VALVAVWYAGFNVVSATAAATGLLAAVDTSTVMVAAVALVIAEILAGQHGRPSVLGPREVTPAGTDQNSSRGEEDVGTQFRSTAGHEAGNPPGAAQPQ